MTNNRLDTLADELIEDDITFHQSGPIDDGMTTNQQHTWPVDGTITRISNFISFH